MTHSENDLVPSMTFPPITRETLSRYALSSKDSNPIHLNDDFARTKGFPSVIAHGMLLMAYLSNYVLESFPSKKLIRFQNRFRKITVPGDVVECFGKIKRVTDKSQLIVEVWMKNQKNELVIDGEAELT